jgi:hypothetical protein
MMPGSANFAVGWVERRETHRGTHRLPGFMMGFVLLNPSYGSHCMRTA